MKLLNLFYLMAVVFDIAITVGIICVIIHFVHKYW